MKLTRVFASLLGVTMGVGYSGVGMVAHAQDRPSVRAAGPTVQKLIRLKNVTPDLVAWWLDPAHNEEPVQIMGLDHNATFPPRNQGQAKTKGVFELPAGILRVTPMAQNVLLVLGTEDAIGKMQETILFLDKPLRQVEVEVQVIQLDEFAEKAFGWDFGKDKPGGLGLGILRGNLEAPLAQVITQNKAKIITAPRVTTFNNITATMNTSPSRPAVVGIKNERGEFQELSDPAVNGNTPLMLGLASRIKVTPTINNDNTVTLLMSFQRVLQLSNEANYKPTDISTSPDESAIANVRDGETIAIKGIPSQFLGRLGNEKKATNASMITLVTARIIRRVGDEVQPVALQR